jgi:hypothetical protein
VKGHAFVFLNSIAVRPNPLPQAEPYPQNWVLDTAGRAQKSEIRNSKSETNPKFETKKTPMNLPDSQELTSGILDFRSFEFVSDFGFGEFELEPG